MGRFRGKFGDRLKMKVAKNEIRNIDYKCRAFLRTYVESDILLGVHLHTKSLIVVKIDVQITIPILGQLRDETLNNKFREPDFQNFEDKQ